MNRIKNWWTGLSGSTHLFLSFFALLIVAGVPTYLVHHHRQAVADRQAQTAKAAALAATKTQTQPTPTPSPAPATVSAPKVEDKTNTAAEILAMAVVHKGEGIEHVLIRQLVANPTNYGFTGDKTNANAVKHWAGRKAHLLAIKAGYVDVKFGAEMRVAAADKVAYVIQSDDAGNLQIAEQIAPVTTQPQPAPTPTSPTNTSGQSASFQVAAVHGASGTIATSQFLGNPGSTVPTYEYLYTGVVAS